MGRDPPATKESLGDPLGIQGIQGPALPSNSLLLLKTYWCHCHWGWGQWEIDLTILGRELIAGDEILPSPKL